MSQKKVDSYKDLKSKREKMLKKERRELLFEKLIGLVVVLAIVGWIGYSGYEKVQESHADDVTETVMDTTAIDNYLNTLSE